MKQTRKLKMKLVGLIDLVFMIILFGGCVSQVQEVRLPQSPKPTLEKVQLQKIFAVNPSAFPVATPESQGISSDALEKIVKIVKGYVTEDKIVGAELVMIKNRRTILHKAFGFKDREEKTMMRKNTIFNIRSMTKPLTGAGIQILAERGELSLKDPIAKYLPGFKNEMSKHITIEQVLAHRSGLPLTIMATRKDIEKYPDLLSMANAIGKEGPQHTPGSKFWYSDAGTNVLGGVIEVASGIPLNLFIEKNLLYPLGMKDTRYNTKKDPLKSDRVASLYVGSVGAWKKFWSPENEPFYPFAWGSQTLYSTPQDYARFLTLWMDKGKIGDKQLLSEQAVSRTLTPLSRMTALGSDMKMPTGFPQLEVNYGQMAMVYTNAKKNKLEPVVIGHNGSDGTFAWAWPKKNLMILYFTQSRGQATGLRLEKHLDQLLINPGQDIESVTIPDSLKFYLGKYTARSYGMQNAVFKVLVQNGSLAVDIPGRMIFELNEPDADGRWTLKLTPHVGYKFKKNSADMVEGMEMTQITSIPRKREEVITRNDCPEKFKGFLGKYTIFGRVFTVTWQNKNLAIDAPGEGVIFLRGPDKKDLWRDPRDIAKVVYFKKNAEGEVKSLNVLQTFQFKKGEAAAVLVEKAINKSGIEAGMRKYQELKKDPPEGCYFDEISFNTLGYKLMNLKKLKEAVEILKLNVTAFPRSWNVYDSLAEVYMKNGDNELAIQNYKKSLELNPKNTSAQEMINKLQEKK